ncbi:MAG: carboxypeptidase regulatory-like domain-containing protein [Acidobacteria bacterium]|nr:carboxypeptidase regulatory-like domain-containing protein [Acidobacteriota bacterium]
MLPRITIFLAVALGSLVPLPLAACSCAPFPIASCERYQQAEIVFVGQVVWEDQPRIPNSKLYLPLKVRLLVTEPFRGIEEQEVEFAIGSSSCDVDFRQGKFYLVYAERNKDTNRLETSICAGTGPVEYRGDQLKYLRGLKTGEIQGQVFGFVTRNVQDIQRPYQARAPVPAVSITLRSGEESWRTVTDHEGHYELNGLPPGSYEIFAELPDIPVQQTFRKFELGTQMCSRQNFLAVPVGQIAGRLLDSDGNPVPNVRVEIEVVPPTKPPEPPGGQVFQKDGNFSLTYLEPGDYLLVVNPKGPPNARENYYGRRVPYPRSYYPGVHDRVLAQVLHLEGGQKIENLEFRLPPRLPDLTITGTVVWPNGLPAQADVYLMDLEYPEDSSKVDAARTKADGSFSVTGAEGRRYSLFAHVFMDESQHYLRGGDQHFHSELLEVNPGEEKTIRLVLSIAESHDSCTINKRFKLF